jgi:hypothetical protein
VANRIGGITAGGGTAIVDGVRGLALSRHCRSDQRRGDSDLDNVEGNCIQVDDALTFALESEAVVYSVVGAAMAVFSVARHTWSSWRISFPETGGGDPVKVLTKETGERYSMRPAAAPSQRR